MRLDRIAVTGGQLGQMKQTIGLIGKAIRDGSTYLPIRNRAAALASLAQPKNYSEQARHVYDDFVKRWRYVKDPFKRELVTTSPKQIFRLVMGGRSSDPGVGFGRGAGDCDDATVAMGAQLASIGFPVRIAVIAPVGAPAGPLMSHVFPLVQIPGAGWIAADPVVYPTHGFGYLPPHSRLAVYNLDGRLITTAGNVHGLSGTLEGDSDQMTEQQIPHISNWQDFSGFGDHAGEDEDLLDFRIHGVKAFGIYSDDYGVIDLGDYSTTLLAEVETDENGKAWTPALELAPDDYQHMRNVGSPYHGMLALGDVIDPDTGYPTVYTWDQNLGFFKKLFRRVKRRVKSVVRKVKRKVKKIARKLLAKIPGGKFLMKLGKKLWKISKKLVGPLMKYIGPIAKKLAPIAALIPGYGPAVAAALYKTGKIADLMKKHGVKIAQKVGKIGKIRFKSGKSGKQFARALKKAAKRQKRRPSARRRGASIMRKWRMPARRRRVSRRAAPRSRRPMMRRARRPMMRRARRPMMRRGRPSFRRAA